jgi:hypothetical protein
MGLTRTDRTDRCPLPHAYARMWGLGFVSELSVLSVHAAECPVCGWPIDTVGHQVNCEEDR